MKRYMIGLVVLLGAAALSLAGGPPKQDHLARLCEGILAETQVGALPEFMDEELRMAVDDGGPAEYGEGCQPAGCSISCAGGSCTTSCKTGQKGVCVCKAEGGPICSCQRC